MPRRAPFRIPRLAGFEAAVFWWAAVPHLLLPVRRISRRLAELAGHGVASLAPTARAGRASQGLRATLRRQLVEGLTGLAVDGVTSGEGLPPPDRHVDEARFVLEC